jgi:hypothetical protein
MGRVGESKAGRRPRKRERPRKPAESRQPILDMAKVTGSGCRRILGELKKLRSYKISRTTLASFVASRGSMLGLTSAIYDAGALGWAAFQAMLRQLPGEDSPEMHSVVPVDIRIV